MSSERLRELGPILAQLLFWGWNMLFFSVLIFGIGPVALFDTIEASLYSWIPAHMGLWVCLLMLVPVLDSPPLQVQLGHLRAWQSLLGARPLILWIGPWNRRVNSFQLRPGQRVPRGDAISSIRLEPIAGVGLAAGEALPHSAFRWA